ncbi:MULTISPECIES: hypothetical protein [Priestia]|uniref:hypothetical protein n=1 Tax=Priestia TaxID=2800373 RepID=UPI001C8E1301|nr:MULTISPECIES: hypothetical protein [Priestia]MBY0062035.1 hypothetical protein [Priestia aryabhattai]MDN3362583.1 hypothetical protein [Priestia megaterium]WKU21477.1 hypothetical protein Q3A90_17030 [Priestia megaterium]
MKNTQIRIETLSYHYENIMVNEEVERAIKSIEVTYRLYKHNHILNGHVVLSGEDIYNLQRLTQAVAEKIKAELETT